MFLEEDLTKTIDLAKQEALLQIYLQHESPDRQKFKSFLQGVKADLIRSGHRHDYKIFISYAWDRGEELTQQQNWLRLLREDLQALGITVFLDVGDMKGDLTKCMQDNIAAADYILLLGTPWLQQRVADESTNAALEWRAITEKCKDKPDALIPLLYKGDFGSSFPPGTLQKLVLDFRDPKQYYAKLASLGTTAGSSLGLLPIILNLRSDESHRTYTTLLKVFELELEQVVREFNLAKERAEKAAQEKASARRQEKLQEILIPEEKFSYDLTTKLGEGGFGEVYLGTWGGHQIAVKMIKIAAAMSPNSKQDIEDEAIAMAGLRSPNIVQIYGVGLRSYALLMEYMPRGSLYNLLHSDAEISEKTKYQIALDVASGLSYLHDRNILHRDLKSLNVLLDSRLRAKLCDFGLAKLKTETRTTTSAKSGTTAWMAPELLQPPPKNKSASKSSDVYALGMILFELASRKHPFEAAGSEQVLISWIMMGATETVPDEAPPVFKKLMTNCWQAYDQRPAAETVFKELAIEFKSGEEADVSPDIVTPLSPILAARPISSRRGRLLSTVVINADSGLSPQEEHLATGRKAKEAEEKAKAAAAKVINATEIAAFLKLVAEGEEDKAEAALKDKPDLALRFGSVTDLSERTFTNITALQYAVWALDWQMWEMIIRYMDRENISVQLSEMEVGSWVDTHGATAEGLIGNLLRELQAYIDNYDKWYEAKDYSSIDQQWNVKVGTAQRQLPVHVVNEYCHPKEAFESLQDFKSAVRYQPSWRTRKTNEDREWFTAIITREVGAFVYGGRGVGGYWGTHPHMVCGRDGPGSGVMKSVRRVRVLLATRVQQHGELMDVYKPIVGFPGISAFLRLVAEGEQEQAEAALKDKPDLALLSGSVTDLSERTFTNITALQYAVWALDWQMWEMIIRYMDREDISNQLNGMVTGSWVDTHGLNAEHLIGNLLRELQIYIDNHARWKVGGDSGFHSFHEQWSVKVGTAQRMLPVHAINEYCHPKKAFYPLPDFKSAIRYQPGWRFISTLGPYPSSRERASGTTLYGSNYTWVRGDSMEVKCSGEWKGFWAECADSHLDLIRIDCTAVHSLLVTRLQQHTELIDAYNPTARPRPGR